MDTSSTTQMATIMGKRWRFSGTSWTKLEWSPICWIIVVKTNRGSFTRTWTGKRTELGLHVRSSKNNGYFCQCMWMTLKWLERSGIWLPCGRNWWKTLTLGNRHHFLTMYTWDALNVNANQMKRLLTNILKMFESRVSAGATEKIPDWEKPTQENCSVVWHGGTCSKMRRAILWTGKQERGVALQGFKSLLGWPLIQAGGTRISWRIVRSLLTNCLEMLVFVTNRTILTSCGP